MFGERPLADLNRGREALSSSCVGHGSTHWIDTHVDVGDTVTISPLQQNNYGLT